MSLTRLLAAAAVSTLLAGPAFAQPAPATPNDTTPPDNMQTSPSVDDAGTPASATAVDPSAPAVVLLSSPTPPDQAWRLKAGDPSVVSNAPVPDTAENRARYGQPMSNGGKRTRAAGN